ncbi:DUF4396 domain-containing protein [Streptomyces hydrogenans]|uniref:DUF4396 domain-containing protein n=1 Tax=Streptomyces hydrogenans TaxID=1873719 RepID=A0ABQ3P930_9ACTN|nr:DUF4396 domain-containing protein [Streptomyces hydrogenans]GHG11163.1 hypothetical protein GCM10018784_24770 [Streptomyces hydrogenans]GHI21528.1 hypothetical protein Shyd_28990 [Streptomyces hydrogenans]
MEHEAHETHETHHRHTGHEGHENHADHHGGHAGHAAHGGGTASWSTAAKATLHCLTGCAIGEVLGMIIGTALGWGNAPTMVLAIALAFFFGYALTLRGVLAAGLDLRSAVRVALAADTLSILVMEIVDNGVLLLVPGAMDAHLDDALFWGALAFAFAVAFLVTTPVNKWMIGRGKGHAVVHRYHH